MSVVKHFNARTGAFCIEKTKGQLDDGTAVLRLTVDGESYEIV